MAPSLVCIDEQAGKGSALAGVTDCVLVLSGW